MKFQKVRKKCEIQHKSKLISDEGTSGKHEKKLQEKVNQIRIKEDFF